MSALFIVLIVVIGVVLVGYGYNIALAMRDPKPAVADEVHSVIASDGWRISLYRKKAKGGSGEPVFLCHSLICNHLNFALPRSENLLGALTDAGYDCWLIDLRGCSTATPPAGRSWNEVTVDDYLVKDIPAALAYIREQTGHEKVHWVGHSLGGMMLYAYDLEFQDDVVASAVTLGSPIGFKGIEYVKPPFMTIGGAGARIAAVVLKMASPFLKSMKLNIPAMPINWDNTHPDFDGGCFMNFTEAVPPRVASETHDWAQGGYWRMRDEALDVGRRLNEVDVPLLAIFGGADMYTPLDRIQEFYDELPNKDKKLLVLSKENGYAADYSHMDLAFAANGMKDVYEPIIEWLRAHAFAGRKASGARTHSARVRKAIVAAAEVGALDDKGRRQAKPKAKAKRKTAAKAKPKATAKTKAKPKAKTKTKAKTKAKAKPKPKTKPVPKKKPAAKKRVVAKKKPTAKKKTAAQAKRKAKS